MSIWLSIKVNVFFSMQECMIVIVIPFITPQTCQSAHEKKLRLYQQFLILSLSRLLDTLLATAVSSRNALVPISRENSRQQQKSENVLMGIWNVEALTAT